MSSPQRGALFPETLRQNKCSDCFCHVCVIAMSKVTMTRTFYESRVQPSSATVFRKAGLSSGYTQVMYLPGRLGRGKRYRTVENQRIYMKGITLPHISSDPSWPRESFGSVPILGLEFCGHSVSGSVVIPFPAMLFQSCLHLPPVCLSLFVLFCDAPPNLIEVRSYLPGHGHEKRNDPLLPSNHKLPIAPAGRA